MAFYQTSKSSGVWWLILLWRLISVPVQVQWYSRLHTRMHADVIKPWRSDVVIICMVADGKELYFSHFFFAVLPTVRGPRCTLYCESWRGRSHVLFPQHGERKSLPSLLCLLNLIIAKSACAEMLFSVSPASRRVCDRRWRCFPIWCYAGLPSLFSRCPSNSPSFFNLLLHLECLGEGVLFEADGVPTGPVSKVSSFVGSGAGLRLLALGSAWSWSNHGVQTPYPNEHWWGFASAHWSRTRHHCIGLGDGGGKQ